MPSTHRTYDKSLRQEPVNGFFAEGQKHFCAEGQRVKQTVPRPRSIGFRLILA